MNATLDNITGEVWNDYRHLITINATRYVLTAIHGRDKSTEQAYAENPDAIRVSLLNTITKQSSKFMLPKSTVFELVKDKGQSYA